MTPDTLDFTGNAVTVLGFIGVVSSFLIIVTAFRRFFNSPYNIQHRPVRPVKNTWEDDCMPPWGHSDLEYMIRHPDKDTVDQ